MSEDLIAKLDPDRNYGPRTFDQILTGIDSGAITIHVGHTLPVLRNGVTGEAIVGGGQPPRPTPLSQIRADMRQSLAEGAAEKWDAINAALFKKCLAGDTYAIKHLHEQVLGRADVPKTDGAKSAVEQLAEGILKNYTAEIVPPPPELLDVVDGESRPAE